MVTVSGNPNPTYPTNPTTKYRCEFVNLNCIYALRLIMVKTNCSTLHTVYNIQQSAMQGSNDTQTVMQDSSDNQV